MMVIHNKLTVKRKLNIKIILEFEESQMFKTDRAGERGNSSKRELKKLRRRNQSNSCEYKQKIDKKNLSNPKFLKRIKNFPSKPEDSSELLLTYSFFFLALRCYTNSPPMSHIPVTLAI